MRRLLNEYTDLEMSGVTDFSFVSMSPRKVEQEEVKQRMAMSHIYAGAASAGTVWAGEKGLPVPPTRLYSGRNLGIQNKASLRNNQGLRMSRILVNTSLPLPPPILPSFPLVLPSSSSNPPFPLARTYRGRPCDHNPRVKSACQGV